ncbi:26S protease regulatory subunit S10B B [Histomonas meleagridis]|uniref:26S protease regulatory subunit S10B-like B n=1 Tax=Histomonas meleagridis TaxID=135588 RepID=UPI00355A356D|nr:26S protease regulatory subunit S10B B [Histomonas meleagridis]KAH0805527.1 26S protease regulatory subunit S10B-like B [Histomonas meleagridis]
MTENNDAPVVDEHEEAMKEYTSKLIRMTKLEAEIKERGLAVQTAQAELDETERQINAMHSVGQKIAEIYRILDGERYIVKIEGDDRFVVKARSRLDPSLLTIGRRVTLDTATRTIMHALPRQVDPQVYHMTTEDPGNVKYSDVGGLGDQINEIREIIELPLVNPEIFVRVGVKAPKGALLYGPPGTGKTLIARAIASSTKASFLKVVSTNLIGSYIGESARLIREMFKYAREHQPCIIFIDEIDALGQRRMGDGQSNDREIQRTLMELLSQMDGFSSTSQVKVVMATNRPDVLDPALLRPGRLDRKIEIPLPNEQGRLEILKIHARNLNVEGDIDFDAIVKLSEGFNGADLRNVCTEAGLFALREGRESVNNDNFMKAVRTVKQTKSLESELHYNKI